MSTDIITVGLEERSYDIHIGTDLLNRAGAVMAPFLRQKQVFVVSDESVAALYLERLKTSLARDNIRCVEHVLPPGEKTKDFLYLQNLLESMLGTGCERGTTVIALGGGVIGDLAGFAASVLLRGVGFIQIPTTLLSQVDSSVGGKTGINSRHGKNLIGTFYQPRLVLADISLLRSLPEREIRAGYAEIVKYALIDDPVFFDWLDEHAPDLLAGNEELRRAAVSTSCAAKARIVADDERESGIRALLNLGHTFGHAFEAESGFSAGLLHGESVALGMRLAFALSVRMGLCPQKDADVVLAHFQKVGLPVIPPTVPGVTWDASRLYAHMKKDKKMSNGKIAFVLVRGIGQAFSCRDVAEQDVVAVLDDILTGTT